MSAAIVAMVIGLAFGFCAGYVVAKRERQPPNT